MTHIGFGELGRTMTTSPELYYELQTPKRGLGCRMTTRIFKYPSGSADLSSWPVGGDQDTSEAGNLLKELILCLKVEANTHRLSWKL